MLSILLSFMVFAVGYFYLTRKIYQICNLSNGKTEHNPINQSFSLDQAIFMLLVWLGAFAVFILFLIYLCISLIPSIFEGMVFYSLRVIFYIFSILM